MVLYVMCSILALFCIIALGWGPVFFAAIGAVGFFVGFRKRRHTWWGLASAVSGLTLALGALTGWRWKTMVGAVVGVFVFVLTARYAGRSMTATPSRQ